MLPRSRSFLVTMKKALRLAFVIATAAFLAQLGCAVLPEDTAEESIDVDPQAAIMGNALMGNGLSLNGILSNALTSNALTSNALTSNGLAMADLSDPLGRQLLDTIVGCALPPGETIDLNIDGVDYSFEGSIGLAPGWGNDGGACDESCRAWVSACVISRVNHLGQSVVISIRGNHTTLVSRTEERAQYTEREGAYFGDIFASPQKIYACVAPGKSQIPRVCGTSIQNCSPIEVLGDCDDVCDQERSDGAFEGCTDPSGTVHSNVVTVFLAP